MTHPSEQKTKVMTVVLRLRVPSKMRVARVADYVRTAVVAERGQHSPDNEGYYVKLERDRVEVFSP